MLKLRVNYISSNLWVSRDFATTLYYVGYKNDIIYKNISAFSLCENKIFAVKQNKTIFIHTFNKNGIDTEDALTLICTLNEKDEYDFAAISLDNTCYNIYKNCHICKVKGRT